MDVFADIEKQILSTVRVLARRGVFALPAGSLPPRGLAVEPPRDPAHGDIATNAALVLARPLGRKPREIAEVLAPALAESDGIARAEVAGPGFINLTLEPAVWQSVVGAILRAGGRYGRANLGRGEKVNVEYVSANPTGPLHVGHGRGAVFGDALANLLAFVGYDVTREYYWNDAGAQIDKLLESIFLRYREALGERIGPFPDDLYPGDYLKPLGAYLAKKYGKRLLRQSEEKRLATIRDYALPVLKRAIMRTLSRLGIKHDVKFNERRLITTRDKKGRDKVGQTIADLERRGLIYRGRLAPPKGKRPDDWEDREQLLFRSTQFGDDVDRPLVKSDGSYTYFATDIAYHRSKLRRGFRQLIDVWGADHGGYVKRMKAAVAALSNGAAELDVKICQLVNLTRGGVPEKMSKRAGTFVTLDEVIDEVGRDAIRFIMLTRKNDAPLDFDFVKVVEKSRDNPVFYVQYAHARVHSVLRNAKELFDERELSMGALAKADLALLEDEGEIALIKHLAAFPRMIASAARAHEPHRIAFYLSELASAFHGQWNRGVSSPHLRFIREDNYRLTVARIALLRALSTVLATGLSLLGVAAPREMR